MEKSIKQKRKNMRLFNNILKVILGFFIISVSVCIESLYFYFTYINDVNNIVILVNNLLKIIFIIFILCKKINLTYKLYWILIIIFIPIFGIIMYLFLGSGFITNKEKNRIKTIIKESNKYLNINLKLFNSIKDNYKYKNFNFLYNSYNYPIYNNQGVKYLETGEVFFNDVMEQINNAKEYIFIELYIYSVGDLLDKILNILYQKALKGVKVIIIMDELGSKFKKPKKFEKYLKSKNIEVIKFNSNIINISKYFTYRDHRKIIIVDGKCAYTGGINIADEYVNNDEKYGYWKDGGIKIFGDAVNSYIVMFGRMYEEITKQKFNYEQFLKKEKIDKNLNGYIMNISNNPIINKDIIENMYINFINSAVDYVYISTPYLILSENILNALKNAVKSGIKVKIVVPKIPDKILVYKATKSFYTECLESGIEIYEYNLGFIHSKMFLSDDNLSIIGSVNFDFRSFNLNYECCTITYNTGIEVEIKKDFDSILRNSNKVVLENYIKRPFYEKCIERIIKLFTPLL